MSAAATPSGQLFWRKQQLCHRNVNNLCQSKRLYFDELVWFIKLCFNLWVYSETLVIVLLFLFFSTDSFLLFYVLHFNCTLISVSDFIFTWNISVFFSLCLRFNWQFVTKFSSATSYHIIVCLNLIPRLRDQANVEQAWWNPASWLKCRLRLSAHLITCYMGLPVTTRWPF